MEEGSVLTSSVPDVRIEEFQTFVAPDVRVEEFQIYRTEVIRKTGKMREWTESLVSTIVFVLIFTTFVAQATQVPTPSMVPTIMVGDHFFLDKIAFPGNFPEAMRELVAAQADRSAGHHCVPAAAEGRHDNSVREACHRYTG